MKLMRIFCALAMVLSLSAVAYAETQSVKVSGDMTVRSFFRDAYSPMFRSTPTEVDGTVGRDGTTSSTQTWAMSTTEVQIDADLTDNVSTCVRLANERDWGVRTKATIVTTPILTEYNTRLQAEYDVGVDLAYVTLKDFIYSPLTLTIGRQDIMIGRGFIVGSNQKFDAAAFAAAAGNNNGYLVATPNGINAPEYTTYNAFDAVKAVLDYNPWTITTLVAKDWESAIQDDDDTNLWGINVGYKFDQYKAEAEAYWFWKQDNSVTKWRSIEANNDVHTIGLRGNVDPIDVLTINLEGAYQFGSYLGARQEMGHRNRSGWAFDAAADFRYFVDKMSWKPDLGIEYIFYSGEEPQEGIGGQNDGSYKAWDRMYRGKYDSAIREWVGTYYFSGNYSAIARADWNQPKSGDASYQNQHQVIFMGSVQPMESLTLKGNCNLFWSHEPLAVVRNTTAYLGKVSGYIGTEFDLQAIWDYTEDVSFGLLGGWFWPGHCYQEDEGNVATDIVGTVKVSF